MTQEEFLRRARDGSICESLNRIPVKKGDMFRISPGTIHAIGAGVLLAEVQQNSDTTFRIYDYLRRDRDGLPRPLHLERAASVLNYEPIELSAFRRADASPDAAFSMSEMFACRYFRVYMLDVRTEGQLRCDGSSFQHILCVDGCGELVKDGKVYPFARGGSYFLPAAMGGCTIRGICRVLLSRL